jgi:hypothetical protein
LYFFADMLSDLKPVVFGLYLSIKVDQHLKYIQYVDQCIFSYMELL